MYTDSKFYFLLCVDFIFMYSLHFSVYLELRSALSLSLTRSLSIANLNVGA